MHCQQKSFTSAFIHYYMLLKMLSYTFVLPRSASSWLTFAIFNSIYIHKFVVCKVVLICVSKLLDHFWRYFVWVTLADILFLFRFTPYYASFESNFKNVSARTICWQLVLINWFEETSTSFVWRRGGNREGRRSPWGGGGLKGWGVFDVRKTDTMIFNLVSPVV